MKDRFSFPISAEARVAMDQAASDAMQGGCGIGVTVVSFDEMDIRVERIAPAEFLDSDVADRMRQRIAKEMDDMIARLLSPPPVLGPTPKPAPIYPVVKFNIDS